ncbi:hypothetical protein [Hyphomicrobium sp. MC1]|uniref:hypothetical protein n=1 Tax=Hyphomicrobium sp. (strain MC1) TaxID=717785 RepID=UPI000213DCE1|nr:hypothetical protein [Hyphomicrobium sp. MC1]CCB64490.1 protein of unknown function [Hyphomicrobium sp. MC1]
MKLTDKQVNIMRLVRRSTPIDGWYKVSEPVWPVVEAAHMPSDLVEARQTDGEHFVRLTEKGETVMEYLV